VLGTLAAVHYNCEFPTARAGRIKVADGCLKQGTKMLPLLALSLPGQECQRKVLNNCPIGYLLLISEDDEAV
jgi:hypothetical protein